MRDTWISEDKVFVDIVITDLGARRLVYNRRTEQYEYEKLYQGW
ncbi:MAG: hypothetical protein ACE5J7_00865 [Candidatus Aenigmatarchaeota archaeon]